MALILSCCIRFIMLHSVYDLYNKKDTLWGALPYTLKNKYYKLFNLRVFLNSLWVFFNSFFRSNPRTVSIGHLNVLLHLQLQPINLIVSKGSYSFRMGNLILWSASRLDAFSVYQIQTWLLCYAFGKTTDAPVVRPSRSSRTKDSSTQISCAHDG